MEFITHSPEETERVGAALGRVIPAALQDMENIPTHSTGTEPNRRVVIEYVR